MQSLFADILSVLAMTYSDTEPRGTLRYRLLSSSMSSTPSDPGSWGHGYIRHLAAELGLEFTSRQEEGKDIEVVQLFGGNTDKLKAELERMARRKFKFVISMQRHSKFNKDEP